MRGLLRNAAAAVLLSLVGLAPGANAKITELGAPAEVSPASAAYGDGFHLPSPVWDGSMAGADLNAIIPPTVRDDPLADSSEAGSLSGLLVGLASVDSIFPDASQDIADLSLLLAPSADGSLSAVHGLDSEESCVEMDGQIECPSSDAVTGVTSGPSMGSNSAPQGESWTNAYYPAAPPSFGFGSIYQPLPLFLPPQAEYAPFEPFAPAALENPSIAVGSDGAPSERWPSSPPNDVGPVIAVTPPPLLPGSNVTGDAPNPVVAVPEPSTWAMAVVGFLAVLIRKTRSDSFDHLRAHKPPTTTRSLTRVKEASLALERRGAVRPPLGSPFQAASSRHAIANGRSWSGRRQRVWPRSG